jgi:energy-coupling factor transport system ATP-binding protein
VIAITGENGIGKTTLAKVLSGLLRQSAGQVSLGGRTLSPAARRKRVWYSDNDTSAQFFTDSVSEELLLCHGRDEETLKKARTLLKELELYEYSDAHPATLSGGQKQRLSIACGLMSGREVLIFDEPTSGLDGRSLRIVSGMLRQAAESGKCVLVITHDNELIRMCCTHLYAIIS